MTELSHLLDTNVCIDFLLGRSAPLAQRMAASLGALAVSAVTAAELRVGSHMSADPDGDMRRIDTFLSLMQVVAFDDAASHIYANVVRQVGVRRRGFDRLIGTQALALGLILVTRNDRDFADIPGLKVEDWTQ
ncbi:MULTISPECIES: type II toxin-antitoxin system VapC family toxin [Sphingobium]|uniref:type II toxin-antitoxin system VapC family toxin n=1 Tax=Sphingobium TaxID=165695 RepID=UPI000E76FC82|nr:MULTISPECIES: type II toxin-antitoxin system VapC family toxin [Sphingobium]KAA9019153.1 type II toxin-antitoxin system VapC family toxin [Sphingobium limneticum]MBU0932894.1 type II toxin-antitoxin system VapC family toxin [Alphaproteobacteria bacterium]